MEKIVLVGGGGHCKVIIDIIKSTNKYDIAGVVDKKEIEMMSSYIPYLGDDDKLPYLYKQGIKNAFVCIGGLFNVRNKMYNELKKIGFNLPTLIHKTAIISPYAKIGKGTCIMPGAIINSGVNIGENCIINSGAIIEHDCRIGFNSHISPKTAVAGQTYIGDNCHLGIGSTILQCIKIGNNTIIGAGAVVIEDIDSNVTAVGVPSKIIKWR